MRACHVRTTAPVASIICPIPGTTDSCPASAIICSYVLCSTLVLTFFGFFQMSERFCSASLTFLLIFFVFWSSSSLIFSSLLFASLLLCSAFSLNPLNAIPIFCGRSLLSIGYLRLRHRDLCQLSNPSFQASGNRRSLQFLKSVPSLTQKDLQVLEGVQMLRVWIGCLQSKLDRRRTAYHLVKVKPEKRKVQNHHAEQWGQGSVGEM